MMTSGYICSFCPLKVVIAAPLGCEVLSCISFRREFRVPFFLPPYASTNPLLCYLLIMVVLASNLFFLVFGFVKAGSICAAIHDLYIFTVTQCLSSPTHLDPVLPPSLLPSSPSFLHLPIISSTLLSSSFLTYLQFFTSQNKPTNTTFSAFLAFLAHRLVQHITSATDLHPTFCLHQANFTLQQNQWVF